MPVIFIKKNGKVKLACYFYRMDAQKIVNCMAHPFSNQPFNETDWKEVIKTYPYFSAAQWMHFSTIEQASAKDIELLALYKNNPLLFASFVKQSSSPKSVHEEIPVQAPSVETVSETVDLIQEEEEVTKQAEEAAPVLNEEQVQENTRILAEVEQDTADILEIIQNLPNTPIETTVEPEEAELEEVLHELNQLSAQTEAAKTATNMSFTADPTIDEDKSLMVMMSFTEWLKYFKTKQQKEQEEEKDQKALKTAWKKEKLAAAVEEEQDDIPDTIFQQAMDSISLESSIISESLAEILSKQGKTDKAIEMYKKLSLRNPEKSAYFASLIKELKLSNF